MTYAENEWNEIWSVNGIDPRSEATRGYPIAKGYWKLFREAEGLIPVIVLMIVTKAKEVSWFF